ncbi:hypothetical protein VNO77_25301 [Canavalia gladiata]|uniref:Secreted protein n=1 Tax=Canavalia gladiata TaxID=3824 RepID=A0AAN9LD15_CANGL
MIRSCVLEFFIFYCWLGTIKWGKDSKTTPQRLVVFAIPSPSVATNCGIRCNFRRLASVFFKGFLFGHSPFHGSRDRPYGSGHQYGPLHEKPVAAMFLRCRSTCSTNVGRDEKRCCSDH